MIYGTGGKDLGNKQILSETCPHCETPNSIHVHGVSKYFHILWIPVFPYSKKMHAMCHNCNEEIPKKEMSPSLKDKIGLEKSSFSTPIYLFSGLLLIGLFIGWLQYNSSNHDKFVKERIHAMEVNDVLVIKEEGGNYSFAIIDSIGDNNYFFRSSNYTIDESPTSYDYEDALDEKIDFYSEDTYYATPEKLDSLFIAGELDILD